MVILLYLFPPHYFFDLVDNPECDRVEERVEFVSLARSDKLLKLCGSLIDSLQNSRVRGASTIDERARKTREQARSARQEKSACGHTMFMPYCS